MASSPISNYDSKIDLIVLALIAGDENAAINNAVEISRELNKENKSLSPSNQLGDFISEWSMLARMRFDLPDLPQKYNNLLKVVEERLKNEVLDKKIAEVRSKDSTFEKDKFEKMVKDVAKGMMLAFYKNDMDFILSHAKIRLAVSYYQTLALKMAYGIETNLQLHNITSVSLRDIWTEDKIVVVEVEIKREHIALGADRDGNIVEGVPDARYSSAEIWRYLWKIGDSDNAKVINIVIQEERLSSQ